jgi:hypothetical protein
MALDDPCTMAELDIPLGISEHRRPVRRAVVHYDLVFERLVFHGPDCTQGASGGGRTSSVPASTRKTGNAETAARQAGRYGGSSIERVYENSGVQSA